MIVEDGRSLQLWIYERERSRSSVKRSREIFSIGSSDCLRKSMQREAIASLVRTDVHTIVKVADQWNPRQAAANFRKHGIDFADAGSVFSDDLAIKVPDRAF